MDGGTLMHGDGVRRKCPTCKQGVAHMLADDLSVGELRGPRQITSSNIDRVFDDAGKRFLFIEEKGPNEPIASGQRRLLGALSEIPANEVWGVKGTPSRLRIWRIGGASSELICEGGWGAYQAAVTAWFDAAPPDNTTGAT